MNLRCPRHLAVILSGLLACTALLSPRAQAMPSYARQTGEECAACHVGAFGPQLTPHGMKFKLEGYAEGKAPSWYLPLSAMTVASFTNTAKAQDGGAAPHFSPNNNAVLQETSVFMAGRLAEGLGMFGQGTYSGVSHTMSWDQVDLRYARTVAIDGKDTIVGLSLNNNPTVQDPFNTLPTWGFPYEGSDLAPGPATGTVLMDAISQQTLGLTAYTQWNEWVYLEAGAYRSLPSNFRKSVGVRVEDQINLDGPAPYWRAAVSHSFKHQFASLGVFGMNAKLIPDPANPAADKYDDIGVDASYQYLGTRKHIFTVNSRYTHEHRSLDGSLAAGAADSASGSVSEYNINASYDYLNTYGFTLGTFGVHGNADAALYGSDPISGSANGSPSSQGMIYQFDYTPFGKEESWMAPWANLRLALQYTAYSKFNGGTTNYDGAGRDATDNNTLFGFLWLAW